MVDVDYEHKAKIVQGKVETATILAYHLLYDDDGNELDMVFRYGRMAGDTIRDYALFTQWHRHKNIFNQSAPINERISYNIDDEENILDEDIRLFSILLKESGKSNELKLHI